MSTRLGLLQHDERRADRPLLGAEHVVARGRQKERRADAPDPAARGRLLRREEQALRDVADAGLAAVADDVVLVISGRMVREMTFQSSLSEIGTTGWILSVQRSPSPPARSRRRS